MTDADLVLQAQIEFNRAVNGPDVPTSWTMPIRNYEAFLRHVKRIHPLPFYQVEEPFGLMAFGVPCRPADGFSFHFKERKTHG